MIDKHIEGTKDANFFKIAFFETKASILSSFLLIVIIRAQQPMITAIFIENVIILLTNSLVFSSLFLFFITCLIISSSAFSLISFLMTFLSQLASQPLFICQFHPLKNNLLNLIFLSSYSSRSFLNKSKFYHSCKQRIIPKIMNTHRVVE